MAQRTVHYVFAQLLSERCDVGDVPRFLFGSLLPDALADRGERDLSHFARLTAEGKRFYDFEYFRRAYAAQMRDPLCLGYYIHLVEDSYHREFSHKVYNFYFTTDEEVHALHRDYHLLNPHLVKTYGLVNRLQLPEDLDRQPYMSVAHFDPAAMLRDFAEDLSEQPGGSFTILSAEMIDSFIARTLPLVEKELRAVQAGERFLRAADFAWKRPSL